MTPLRRTLLKGASALGVSSLTPMATWAQTPAPDRVFQPQAGRWRTFDVTTRVDITGASGATQVWLPLPSVETPWQRGLGHQFSGNGSHQLVSDGQQGVRMLHSRFSASTTQPSVVLTSRVSVQDRTPRDRASSNDQDPATLRHYTRPTRMLPTDGIVKATALKATQGASNDADKVRAIYDWVVANAWREPKVRGCGEGDIKTMLETGNLGGKCADINALFVGLCRSVGVPARDVYGLRLAPSAFGYKELSGNPSGLQGAQHCRAEVFVRGQGWLAMDPADVAKVMRLETPQWLKSTDHAVVKPVYQGLFGGWEGNWMAWNTAHDLVLPGSQHGELNFFMYPVAENALERWDSYAPNDFKYHISAVEIRA